MKAGWKTSEFWLTVLGQASVVAAAVAGAVSWPIAAPVAAGIGAVYTVARTFLKSKE